ncbi:WD40 repeat domain-containing protein [Microcoleus sp. FACHB-831]|uniref:WD40 repeat domain-containing protein n=1 Tax=Microcoleus sp. FACHB-831 TaxID=2692827 RepID=UPI0016881CD5|nr:WD40 repeat domain-containing protein [Microcoleus sp. FACHB-831]MBD1924664.1 WD40 repeat domain-containing protein [Microcoleus sp. FACHB-831]
MPKSLISASVSAQVVKFRPGGAPATFTVTVTNESAQFATFLLEVTAAGADAEQNYRWYSLSPAVGAKKPPGDSTQFSVVITDSPVPGFVGNMNLAVRIFSLEMADEDRQIVRLVLEEGLEQLPMKLELPVREFQAIPGDRVEVPVRVYNPSQKTVDVLLSFVGVEPTWLAGGAEQRVQLRPGGKVETTFLCQLATSTLAASKTYPFAIKALANNGSPSSIEGNLTVLPSGAIDFSCTPAIGQIPAKLSWFPRPKANSTTYKLRFDNLSNLNQEVSAAIASEDLRKFKLQVIPHEANLAPGETTELQLVIGQRRPWFGVAKKYLFEVKAIVSDLRLDVRNDTQIAQLRVLPVIQIWMQLFALVLLLFLAWWFSWLNPNNPFYGHQAPVNSVQINGSANELVSGSNDQTLIKWDVIGFFNPLINQQREVVGNAAKAVRVIRYRPVENNLVAAGLENGEIQLWNILGGRKRIVDSFVAQKDDRVLALEFTKDSRYLFSGHGSGQVLQWNVERYMSSEPDSAKQPILKNQLDFAIYGLAFVGKEDKNLAIVGRYNQMKLWNWTTKKLTSVNYNRPGGQDDYITSIDSSDVQPNLLVTADNQGYITLWNMGNCLEGNGACEVLDEWQDGHGGKPVRSVALSDDGCYLASSGDDAKVMLWPLTLEGKRADQFSKGNNIGRGWRGAKINSVDIKLEDKYILVASGSDDTEVRLHRVDRLPQLQCDK